MNICLNVCSDTSCILAHISSKLAFSSCFSPLNHYSLKSEWCDVDLLLYLISCDSEVGQIQVLWSLKSTVWKLSLRKRTCKVRKLEVENWKWSVQVRNLKLNLISFVVSLS